MITYELAKKLKKAGFPQKGDGKIVIFDFSYPGQEENPVEEWVGKARGLKTFTPEYIGSDEGKRLMVYNPTLSELIEACGDEFFELQRFPNGEFAALHNPSGTGYDGKTPEEAVVKLWLKLNEPKNPKNSK